MYKCYLFNKIKFKLSLLGSEVQLLVVIKLEKIEELREIITNHSE